MPSTEPRLLHKLEGAPWEIEPYLRVGGYDAWRKCVMELSREGIVAEIRRSGLRGRGGAGFPTGTKWDKVLHHRVKERYFVCNAGEHEPGTFKDRYLLKHYPHQLLEGCLIAAFTVRAKASFIYVNQEYEEERANLAKAIEQARTRGLLGTNVLGTGLDLDIELFAGQGSYVAGEETAMLESMQGRPAMPRQKPPFYPTDFGLYGKPTLVNNVETLCNVPRILRNGAGWFAQVRQKHGLHDVRHAVRTSRAIEGTDSGRFGFVGIAVAAAQRSFSRRWGVHGRRRSIAMVPVRFAIDLQLHVQIKQTENRIGRRAQPAAGGHLCRTGWSHSNWKQPARTSRVTINSSDSAVEVVSPV